MLHLTNREFDALQNNINIDTLPDKNKTRANCARSLSNGKAFEELIGLSCKQYRDAGTACIIKTPEPFAVFSRTKDGLFTGRFTAAKAQPDFQGILSGGKSIIFEAKFTSKDRILQSVITQTQASILDEHLALGGLCFVAVSIEDRYFFVPWNIWKDMKQLYGRKYLKTEDMNEYEVFPHIGNPFPFLDIALGLAERESSAIQ